MVKNKKNKKLGKKRNKRDMQGVKKNVKEYRELTQSKLFDKAYLFVDVRIISATIVFATSSSLLPYSLLLPALRLPIVPADGVMRRRPLLVVTSRLYQILLFLAVFNKPKIGPIICFAACLKAGTISLSFTDFRLGSILQQKLLKYEIEHTGLFVILNRSMAGNISRVICS